jgi:hypothetical protein
LQQAFRMSASSRCEMGLSTIPTPARERHIGPCAWPLDERAVSRRRSGHSSDAGNQGAP